MSNTKDMTVGSPAKLIFFFALPLMLGNVFQQLYTMVDTAVVGQFVGVEGLAALGAADWMVYMIWGVATGFTQGFSILISQRWGAADHQGLRKSIAMSVYLCAGIVLILSAVSQLIAYPALRLLNTPENIRAGALTYMRIRFAGVITITFYNMCASVLRALGDSKTPLVAMIVSSGVNIALDLLFVVGFHWGIAGAAVATVTAEACAGILCLIAIRRVPVLRFRREDWTPDRTVLGKLFLLGLPMSFQNIVIGGGGLVVQRVINGFGFLFVAGITATNKLYGILDVAASSFGFSVATFAGQNLGANKLDRIRQGTRSALKICLGLSLVISSATILLGRYVLRLFISDSAADVEAVLGYAYDFLFVMSVGLCFLYTLFVYRSALQGMGDTFIPMVSGMLELAARISCVLLLPRFVEEYGVYLSEVAAWFCAMVLLIAAYYWRIHRLSRKAAEALPEAPAEE